VHGSERRPERDGHGGVRKAKESLLRGFLTLKNGIPSHDTFSRLFRLLDPDKFAAAFQRFMAAFSRQCQGVIAIDGKVLRRSFDRASDRSALDMVSAWGCEQRMVLGQIATDMKSNEITAVPKLLEMLSLKGTIVTKHTLPRCLGSQRSLKKPRKTIVSSNASHPWGALSMPVSSSDPGGNVSSQHPTDLSRTLSPDYRADSPTQTPAAITVSLTPLSADSRICARFSFRAACLPPLSVFVSWSRSVWLSSTRYRTFIVVPQH
jgi:hypothetical protein